MAEPLAALGLAANILQLLEFGSKTVSQFRSIYQGYRDKDSLLDIVSTNREFQDILANLRSETKQTNGSPNLVNLAKDSQAVANELATFIRSLMQTGTDSTSKFEALRLSIKRVWNEDKLKAIQMRLAGFQNQLMLSLLASIR